MLLSGVNKSHKGLDFILSFLVIAVALFGIVNIYSVELGDKDFYFSNFVSSCSGKQTLWLLLGVLLCFVLNSLESRVFSLLSPYIYILGVLMLIATVIFSRSVAGHNAWLQIGGLRIQPAEFAKGSTALALALILSDKKGSNQSLGKKIYSLIITLIPILCIILQGDIGSCLVFFSFALVFLREGYFVLPIAFVVYVGLFAVLSLIVPQVYLSISILCLALTVGSTLLDQIKRVIGLGVFTLFTFCITYGTNFFVNEILKPHQRNRIISWISSDFDPLGIGWNITQSKIAIGSGGFFGKGVFQGTQTRYGFVPEQHTDFIFCTVGEEYGWIGSTALILAFLLIITRIFFIAERQTFSFARIYGYGVGAIIFCHFIINVGMTIGLAPVIGIPLPFMSYGGSALLSFMLMIFLLLKFDSERSNSLK